jgi:hypothetical protein
VSLVIGTGGLHYLSGAYLVPTTKVTSLFLLFSRSFFFMTFWLFQRFRNWIEAAWMEGVAAQYSTARKP